MQTVSEFKDEIARRSGVRPQTYWREPGPALTNVKYHAMVGVNGRMVYVQFFKDGGWEVFRLADETNSVSRTLDAVIDAFGLEPKPSLPEEAA